MPRTDRHAARRGRPPALPALEAFALGLAIGRALGLPGGGGQAALDGLVRLLVGITGVAGVVATVTWWNRADHDR